VAGIFFISYCLSLTLLHAVIYLAVDTGVVVLLTEYYSSSTHENFVRLWPFLDPLRPSEDTGFLLCISLCGVQGQMVCASTPISFFLFACKQLQNQ